MRILQGLNGNEWGRTSPVYILEFVVGVTTLDETRTTVDESMLLITDENLAGSYVEISRGNVNLPGIDPGDGSDYYTKEYESNQITFQNPLVTGEIVKIKTL